MAEPAETPVSEPEKSSPEPIVSNETVSAPAIPEVDADGAEPGGDDPQAVRARKEYRGRKKAQEEADRLRVENVRVTERLKTIEEERQRAPVQQQDKVFTIAEINAAVEAGTVQRVDADRYIEEVIVPRRVEKVLSDHQAKVQQRAPIDRAIQDIGEYRKYIPSLNDRTHPDFDKVRVKYNELVGQGLNTNEVTERLAVEMAHGSLELLRKRAEVAALNAQPRLMTSDAGAGGGIKQNGKIDVSKAPAHLVKYWENTGTSPADREKEMTYWQKNQQKAK